VSHREPESLLGVDLSADNLAILQRIKATVDRHSGEVTTTFLGLIKRRARFRPGLGCTLCYDSVPLSTVAPSIPSPADLPPLPEHLDHRLDAALDWAFSEPDPQRLRRTRALVIVHKGRVVAERYAPGFGMENPLPGWSMAKTVINALVGIMIGQGRLSLDGPLPVPEWRGPGDPRRRITLDHLMRMSSGLRFQEDYGNPLQDVTRMLFSVPDAAAYAANKRLEAEAGTKWSYSSGTTNIISRLIRQSLGDDEYLAFPRKALFNPLGMAGAVMEPDASGTLVGSSFMYSTARDWARLGQLFLQDGAWEGQRLLPEGWVRYSTTPAPLSPGKEYGAHLWLKVPADFASGDAVPVDAFHAVGHEGQFVTVIPSRDLVIVRLGLTRYPGTWLHDRFIKLVVKAVGP
jgi:CubicO group peptidase (beta-lactamase class C family)